MVDFQGVNRESKNRSEAVSPQTRAIREVMKLDQLEAFHFKISLYFNSLLIIMVDV